ncbi:type III secretion translocon protein HrpF [Sinorhizobium terangae]|uniref:Nodulation protein NOLX n=1 Tax=Sinorhizobium terangae TaxID=110322 RepID=A0A6N7LGD2_SINTE|nr:HrpF/NolX family T3SS translocon protein [Sinorhizobium terangae]MBB4189003.1 type III secretion translocon protein HrpF [Sinorhizobium terangae]MQX16279.1 nodulation protein NOLX [Sinorhizobium terangae]
MSISNLSSPVISNPTQSLQASSALGYSAQMLSQAQQQAQSSFESMLSAWLPDGQTHDPFVQRDMVAKNVKSTLEELKQHPMDLLPAQMRAAIESTNQDPPPCAVGSYCAAPAPIPSSRITWNGGSLTETELQIVAVLNRHKDQCPLSWDSLGDKANDPSTPPDLKTAIQGLQQDPELFYAIGSQGDGRCGGSIKAKDLSGFSELHSQVAAFQDQQAQSYVQNYIPSDGTGNGHPSVMTLSSALRELYRYSDYLPKNLSLADFRQIVDGQAKTGKCPPQVIAAAQYFLNHPDDWKQLYGGAIDKVHKEDFLQVASSSMSLTQTELDTLKTINGNRNTFFGSGDLTRDKLASIAANKSLDPRVRQAASQLLSDPVLFALLNNSITGYKTHHKFFDFGGGHTVDSGNISQNDFTQFATNMSAANRTVQQTKTHVPETAAAKDAVADMMAGAADQPDIKSAKKNGGAFMHAINDVAKAATPVLDWAATAVGVLSFVPGLGQVADLVSAGLEIGSQAVNLLHTAISGGNMKQALEEAGLNLGAQAIGLVSGPQVKLAIRNGLVKKAVEEAATAGINLPLSTAQTYAQDYLNNLQARLKADSVPAAAA